MADYDGKKPNRANESSYKTKYPYNKAMLTESGHEWHWDDTPGAERIRLSHRKGTYIEISPDGKRVDFNVGNYQQYNKGGLSLTIDENGDMKISGHQRVNVSGGSHITVRGDADIVVGGDASSIVGGDMAAGVAGDMYTGVAGDMNMNIGGNMNMTVDGDTTMETRGDHVIKATNIRLN
jgi:hypothetical protein